MHPEEFRDTDPRALAVWLELQRNMPRGEKLAAVLQASELVLQMYEMGVRRLHPDADDHEVLLRVAARHLPRQLMLAVYGWDPEEHGEPR